MRLNKKIEIIAEVKTHSPFGFVSSKSWDELFVVANEIGDMLSIHTDARWNGSFDLIKKAKSLTSKPILAKGIHEHDDQIVEAINAGADFVLVVGRIPNVYREKCIIEPLTLEELKTIPQEFRVLWNSRDLKTGGLKTETFKQARARFPGWLIQGSNIKTTNDVQDGADAILIGTYLEEFRESLTKIE